MQELKHRLEQFTAAKSFYVCIFVVSILVMFQRKPYVLMYPNFWAEDGGVFYPQLYHDGLKSFLYPYAGYFHFVPRLVMLMTLPFGIINAPFISNLMALILRAMPMLFLFSRRFNFLGLASKFFLWGYALLAPNILEVVGNITNAQWNMALYLLMVLIAEPPVSRLEKFHDCIVLILSGLSGPFIVFLAPLFLINIPRKSIKFRITALLFAAVQVAGIMYTSYEFKGTKPVWAKDFSLDFVLWAVRVFDSRILWGTFLPLPRIFAWINNRSVVLSVLVFLVFAVPMVYFFIKGSWRLRVCAYFGAAVFMAGSMRLWSSIQDSYIITRFGATYYYTIQQILLFSFVIFLVMKFLEHKPQNIRQKTYLCVAGILLCIGLLSFSLEPPPKNLNYREDIRTLYYPAPAGAEVEIPINPMDSRMRLIKKGD